MMNSGKEKGCDNKEKRKEVLLPVSINPLYSCLNVLTSHFNHSPTPAIIQPTTVIYIVNTHW